MLVRYKRGAGLAILAITSACSTQSINDDDRAETPSAWSSSEFDAALQQSSTSTATLFAPGQISDGMDQRDTAISFNRHHFLYTLQSGRDARIMHVRHDGKEWLAPITASFSGQWRDLEAVFVPSTLQLYFVSNRPLESESEADDFNIWRTKWTGSQWATPQAVTELNTDGNEFYPSITTSGDLYYTSKQIGGLGGEDIWVAKATADGFATPTPLGPGVNSSDDEFNAAIDPTGKYLVFGALRQDGRGGGDLYLSEVDANGIWQPASLLPGDVNGASLDFCPLFFGELGELWFTSRRVTDSVEIAQPTSLHNLRQSWYAAGNGLGDLYRIRIW